MNSDIPDKDGLAVEMHERALEYHRAGHFVEAEELFRKILIRFPESAELYKDYGNTLLSLGHFDAAERAYQQALLLKADYGAAYNNLGNVLLITRRLEEAEQAFLHALSLMPDNAQVYNNYGNVLLEGDRIQEAEQAYLKSTLLDPGFAQAYFNHANVLMLLGQYQNAEKEYRKAIVLKADYYEASCNLADVLNRLDRQDEAETVLRQILEFWPELVEAHNNLGNVLKNMGRLVEADISYRQALKYSPDCIDVFNNLLLSANYAANHDPSSQLEDARQYGQLVAGRVAQKYSTWTCSSKPVRLRVGLVSGDFRNHPVGYFLESVLAHIDLSRIELIAYPTQNEEDELTARIKSYFSSWKSLASMNDKIAAELIHSDGVHVLVDLSGHTASNRLPIFAWKPAPVQATWLGYLATTGIAEIDYLIGDPQATPVENDWQFSESVWRLPEVWACFTPPDPALDVSPLPALSNRYITFGCFNNLTKMNDSMVALWARVLRAIPGSRLFLKTKQLDNPVVTEATRQRFANKGIDPNRLILEGASPRLELLGAYNRVDIALDPYPYGGGTTSFELLWMGVPLITRKGNSFLSRCGYSLVHNVGLSDWVAIDEDDYVLKSVRHAHDLNQLSKVRANLRQQVLASPLFTAPRFARHFEDALYGMWQSHEDLVGAK